MEKIKLEVKPSDDRRKLELHISSIDPMDANTIIKTLVIAASHIANPKEECDCKGKSNE